MYYNQHLSPDMIVRRLMEGEDREVCSVVGELAIDKYEITVRRFRESMTTKSSWLVITVPHTLVLLAVKRLENSIAEIKKQILQVSSTQEQMDLLSRQVELQKLRQKILDNNKR